MGASAVRASNNSGHANGWACAAVCTLSRSKTPRSTFQRELFLSIRQRGPWRRLWPHSSLEPTVTEDASTSLCLFLSLLHVLRSSRLSRLSSGLIDKTGCGVEDCRLCSCDGSSEVGVVDASRCKPGLKALNRVRLLLRAAVRGVGARELRGGLTRLSRGRAFFCAAGVRWRAAAAAAAAQPAATADDAPLPPPPLRNLPPPTRRLPGDV